MKNKILLSLIVLVGTITLTGCGADGTFKLDTKGKCNAVDCVSKITPDNTVEQINDIIGFDGTLKDSTYNSYYWELSEDTGVEVTYYSGTKGTVKAVVPNEKLANKNVNFSDTTELKTKVNGGIDYDTFKTYMGNVDGILIEKSSISNKYIWVNENGEYINASFSNSTGLCTYFTGRVQ